MRTPFLLLLLLLAWLPYYHGLQTGLFRQTEKGKAAHCLTESSSSYSTSNARPAGWRRVLSFGTPQRRLLHYSNDLYYMSAVPSDSRNETTANGSSTDATSAASLRQEAEEWRRRAREIMKEVQFMEAELQKTRFSSQQKRQEETVSLIDRMFRNRPLTPEACAQVMRNEKWSPEEAQMVLDGLFAQAYGTASTALTGGEAAQADDTVDASSSSSTRTTSSSTLSTTTMNDKSSSDAQRGDADVVPTFNATQTLLIEAKMDCLIYAAEILDEIAMASKDSVRRWPGRVGSILRARRNDLRRANERNLARQISVYQGAAVGNASAGERPAGLMEDQFHWPGRSTMNSSQTPEQLPMIPLWVPSTLIQFLAASPSRIEASDIVKIREKVLSGTAFFCTSTESIVKAAIFRGNIRGVVTTEKNMTAVVLDEIQKRLKEEGLADRLQVFLLPDPEWRMNRDQTVVQEPPKPVILAIPADVVPDERKLRKKKSFLRRALKASAATIPIFSAFVYSAVCYALNPKFFDAVMKQRNPAILSTCLPVFLGLVFIQAVHECAHLVVARKRGIKIGLPFPLPSFQIGTFGCITPLRSFPKNRAALLDFALSGPVSAMLVSIGLMVAGIRLTVRASGPDILGFPVLPIYALKSSFLAGVLMTVLAPKSMILPLSQPLPMHPLFVVGFAGLISSSLNILPVFRLDGGRACSAAMGSRFCAVTSSGTLVFMFSLALSSTTGIAVSWGIFILLLQRRFEIPVRDELTDVDDVRLAGWIGSLATAILALAPFPGGSCLM